MRNNAKHRAGFSFAGGRAVEYSMDVMKESGEEQHDGMAFGEFVDKLVHDLKSPLVTIKSFIDLSRRDAAGGDMAQLEADLGRIDDAADRMLQDLNEFGVLWRAGWPLVAPVSVPLSVIAEGAVAGLNESLGEAGVRVDIEPGLPTVCGDRERLSELLGHLLSNAANFTGDQPSPRVTIHTRDDSGVPVICVTDNGMGISREDLGRVLELFVKLDLQSEGAGVGLSIARRIAEVHGGRLWIESEGAGSGCTACFTLGESAG